MTRMKLLIFALFAIGCNQRRLYLEIPELTKMKITVIYGNKNYPKLIEDKNGNMHITIDSGNTFYISTEFNTIKSMRPIFCFKNLNNRCFLEEYDLEHLGYRTHINSVFSSDTTQLIREEIFILEKHK